MEHSKTLMETVEAVVEPRIPQRLTHSMLCVCSDSGCGQQCTLAAGELWPAYCYCGAVLACGCEPERGGE